MVAMIPFLITKDHLKAPEASGYHFAENEDQKIICPISLDELKEGNTCYKVNCCSTVFLQENLTRVFETTDTCPLCRASINTGIPLKQQVSLLGNPVITLASFVIVLVDLLCPRLHLLDELE